MIPSNFRNFFLNRLIDRADGHLCNRDLENLQNWKSDDYLMPQRAENLTPQGAEDIKLLARRLQSNFPELLQTNPSNVTSTNYKVSVAIHFFFAVNMS